jgi:uncharacterized protein (TIGR02996 family)
MTNEREALLAAVRANPEDRTARLVYADWLDEHDDPLGRYVRAEAELLACEPGGAEWSDALRRLRELSASAASPLGGWEYATDLDRIRAKIDRLRAADPDRHLFGARWNNHGHDYQLDATLSECELIDFELRHGLTLPAEYRAFLLRVGNGRVGPHYGLIPLDPTAERPELPKPFGVTPAEADAIAAAVRAARETKNWKAVPKFRREWSRRGYMELADIGCGNSAVLVVNGPMRGEVWAEGDWFVPHRDRAGFPEGFLAWYEKWLDLAPAEIEWRASRARQ